MRAHRQEPQTIITIRMAVTLRDERSPYKDALTAVRALSRAVETSNPDQPALGGALRDPDGERLGSYIVEFKETR